ncbi:DUF4126 family protein [Roseomonas populi]|uniref:DUF4126 family protein n=1 Tax=Roseomonas populi TaxID=3121582 RepID=A0ABT1WYL1_9PROT|nr:DUF4126 family protein [Roseomonas pecuniae]MCR0980922.1 DUF4126 family protein [Roseomonas pecuniae]
MIRSLLIGIPGGMRSMTPLAAVTVAARRGALPRGNGAPSILSHPWASWATVALAIGELIGDKLPSAPDRIIAPGIGARLVTGAVAGMALAPREKRGTAALLGAAGAVAASYITFDARIRSMRRHGQVSTGLVEDAIMLAATLWIVGGSRR